VVQARGDGTFRSQCVELCGKEHGFMPIVVRVVSQEDYGKWVGEQKQALLAQADDPNRSGIERAHRARREGLRRELRRLPPGHRQGHAARVPAAGRREARHRPEGRPPRHRAERETRHGDGAFGKQLSDTDIAAVISYERNTWGNKSGIVQPAEVKSTPEIKEPL